MTYLPKSKFSKLFTSGDEYTIAGTKKPYVGPYIKTSTGAYAGHNSNNLRRVLAKIKYKGDLNADTDAVIEGLSDTKMRYSANAEIYKKISKKDTYFRSTRALYGTKNKPTKEDYEKGRYVRYFAKKNNSNVHYIEIDKATYKSLSSKTRKHDYGLYTAGKIDWALEGNVVKVNRGLLLEKSKEFPNIGLLFPKLNEFQKLLYSDGSELVYRDDPSRKYVGYYHIHPDKGPMEGSVHKSIPHARLMFITNSIVEENPAFEYEAPESIRDQISQTPNMTPDDVTYSDGDSSGGHSHDSGPPAPSTPVDSNGNAYANGSSFTGGGGGY